MLEEKFEEEEENVVDDLAQDPALPVLPSAEFITGEAGTGKTWLVRERAKKYRGHVLCATTGIAAVNLGEGVTTINSLLKYFDTASLRDSWTQGNLERIVMGQARSGLRQIVLDEVSMLDGEQLTIITATVDSVNERLQAAGEPGLGLTLTGDFCLALGTKVRMADKSLKTVEEVQVGDELLGPDLESRRVLRLVRGSGKLFAVKQSKGQTYTVSQGHQLVLRRTNTEELEYVKLSPEEYLQCSTGFLESLSGWQVDVFKKNRRKNLGEIGVEPGKYVNVEEEERNVVTVKEAGDGEFAGFHLTGDRLFLLEDGTVVHNCQLPPVKAKFAFEVEEWGKYRENMTKLTEVRRQADLPFVQALGAARKGKGGEALEFFRSASGFNQLTDYDFNGTTLLAKNDEVDKFNFLRMGKLQGEKIQFTSTRWGKERGEWKNIPEKLDLKVGALVMILSNLKDEEDPRQLVYANGDLGTLVEVDGDGVPLVKLARNSRVVRVSYVSRDNKIPLEPGRRKELKAEGKSELISDKYEIIGNVTYMPLRVAYACTVHKSQGLSLDNVQIDFRQSFYGSFGMLYVALSRGRTAGGLRLVGNEQTFIGRMKVDPKVKEWM